MSKIAEKSLQPFLKWAGGKRWLAGSYSTLLISECNRYIEPFLGGGAVFFHIRPPAALLADINPALINCYKAVRDQPKQVEEALRRHSRRHSSSYYYEERSKQRRSKIEKAAQLLYLNRTCWNGLYRVNLRGEFNVPIGTKSSVLLPTDDFPGAARALKQAKIVCQDFEKTINEASDGDFVFADPPYTVKHNLNGFVKYNESIFSWDDQKRLRDSLLRAKSRGAKILIMNADHESVRSLYRGFGSLKTLQRSSVLAGDARYRGPANELSIYANGTSK